MLPAALIFLAIIILALVVYVKTRPDDFKMERSCLIPAPPSAVFEQVNNLQNWEAWSPWAKLDPDAVTTFSGPVQGEGASFHWSGNNKVGEGTNTIIESTPSELVRVRLEFLRPFRALNTTDFHFAPEADQTRMTWSMYGKNNTMAKAMSLFMDCEKMVGPQFESGLANIKRIVESSANPG